MITSGWLFVGGARVEADPREMPASCRPSPSFHADVLAAFGIGSFNGFVRILRPSEVALYGDRLGITKGPFTRHAVFAESDNGDALSWDIGGGDASPAYAFAPRSTTPKLLARDARALVAALREKITFGAPPHVPYFVRGRKRHVVRARHAADGSPAFVSRLAKSRGLTLLESRKLLGGAACTLHHHDSDGLLSVQWAAGWWSLMASVAARRPIEPLASVLERAFPGSEALAGTLRKVKK